MRLSFGAAPFFGSMTGSPVTYGSRRRSLVGSEIFAIRSFLGRRHCERSEAISLHLRMSRRGDCFVASLLAMTHSSYVELRHVHPAPLCPALEPELGELHALGAFGEVVLPRRSGHHVADEVLPLDLEAVVVGDVLRQLLPLVEEF